MYNTKNKFVTVRNFRVALRGKLKQITYIILKLEYFGTCLNSVGHQAFGSMIDRPKIHL